MGYDTLTEKRIVQTHYLKKDHLSSILFMNFKAGILILTEDQLICKVFRQNSENVQESEWYIERDIN